MLAEGTTRTRLYSYWLNFSQHIKIITLNYFVLRHHIYFHQINAEINNLNINARWFPKHKNDNTRYKAKPYKSTTWSKTRIALHSCKLMFFNLNIMIYKIRRNMWLVYVWYVITYVIAIFCTILTGIKSLHTSMQ